MPVTELRIGDQSIRYDRDRTAAAYGTIEQGDAERCGCVFCKNFAIQRNLVYPPSFLAFLEQLGIDANKEAEVYECGPVTDGWHLYGGWFYLVGELVTAGERNTAAPDAQPGRSHARGEHPFEFFFTTSHPDAAAFRGGSALAIEFTTRLKWVLPENPGYRTASEDTRRL